MAASRFFNTIAISSSNSRCSRTSSFFLVGRHSKQVRFAVQNDPPHAGGPAEETLIVIFQSQEPPDLFKDGAEVVVEGKLQQVGGDTVLLADNVMAKCPSKFQAKAETSAL